MERGRCSGEGSRAAHARGTCMCFVQNVEADRRWRLQLWSLCIRIEAGACGGGTLPSALCLVCPHLDGKKAGIGSLYKGFACMSHGHTMLKAAGVVADVAARVEAEPHLVQLLPEDLCLPCHEVLHNISQEDVSQVMSCKSGILQMQRVGIRCVSSACAAADQSACACSAGMRSCCTGALRSAKQSALPSAPGSCGRTAWGASASPHPERCAPHPAPAVSPSLQLPCSCMPQSSCWEHG